MLAVTRLPTKPFLDQKPGTSGLRKKVKVFQQENYLSNFVQSTFNAIKKQGTTPDTLVLGGDGRYFLAEAIQTIIKLAAANGVSNIWVGKDGLLSTPAVSNIIRQRRDGNIRAKGAFILTASHNPGGPEEDFGIKYNTENGGPAADKLTSAIYEETLKVDHVLICPHLGPVNVSEMGDHVFDTLKVSVISSTEDYVQYMQKIFDFQSIRKLLHRPDFKIRLDALNGIGGPYLREIFVSSLGLPEGVLHGATPLPDFGKHHPDPNLTYAKELVEAVGVDSTGTPLAGVVGEVPNFAAAFDGDADRNMILGDRFFVTPSDSLAILAANANVVPFFAQQGGVKAVARSMPTSGAVDRVAEAQHFKLFEVPTGWKFFGNLMDSQELFGGENYNPLICGEESFGTGSNHMREKDGVWAALFWLSVIASKNVDQAKPLVGVKEIAEAHWTEYGRNYYCRYDYEGVTEESARAVMETVQRQHPEDIPALQGKRCVKIDNFEYHDPVDGLVSKNQGIRVLFECGSRFVLRLSGTGSSGATIRLYLEQYMEPQAVVRHIRDGTLPTARSALAELIALALKVAQISSLTGRDAPTVIT
ncbi:putative phosphoglucomutase [Trypanosoma conorhini]|uniref:phosphoglucomutase (alpha-D-glucose-1,6-bisphosphate-dependent) n=1 Tax=Trypanosoma conorhini TaxID=83891 RepID=A0A422PIU7_9TRYP|nr:putative phosphoglucomutase [Trypanosoma conorhini]RNF17627.1 putative phosphoglucomutase [Trypanosoma conorhini]